MLLKIKLYITMKKLLFRFVLVLSFIHFILEMYTIILHFDLYYVIETTKNCSSGSMIQQLVTQPKMVSKGLQVTHLWFCLNTLTSLLQLLAVQTQKLFPKDLLACLFGRPFCGLPQGGILALFTVLYYKFSFLGVIPLK